MKTIIFAAVLGTSLIASVAGAQPVQPVPPAVQIPPAPPVPPSPGVHFGGRMQGDRTRAQAQQMADAMFQRFDLNHDGVLTRDEAQQALAQAEAARGGSDGDEGGPGGGRAARMIDRMFAGAPSVTIQQFEAQALARFDRQDVNHDGVVTSEERRQGWGGRAQ